MSPRPAQYQKVAPRSTDDLLWEIARRAALLVQTPPVRDDSRDITERDWLLYQNRVNRLRLSLDRLHERVNP